MALTWVISLVPIFHITQPLGINGLLDGYYKVMCNIPKSWDIYQPLFGMALEWGSFIKPMMIQPLVALQKRSSHGISWG